MNNFEPGEEDGVDFAFARKVAASDGVESAVDVAENKDLIFIIENSCMSCDRILAKNSVKIIPPRYLQERDSYVRNGIVSRRIMCAACYNKLRYTLRVKDAPIMGLGYRRSRAARLINGLWIR